MIVMARPRNASRLFTLFRWGGGEGVLGMGTSPSLDVSPSELSDGMISSWALSWDCQYLMRVTKSLPHFDKDIRIFVKQTE